MHGSAAAFKQQQQVHVVSSMHETCAICIYLGRHCCRMPSEEEEEGAISSSRHCASASPNIEVSQRRERDKRVCYN